MHHYNPTVTLYYAFSGAAYPTDAHPNTAAPPLLTSIPLDACLLSADGSSAQPPTPRDPPPTLSTHGLPSAQQASCQPFSPATVEPTRKRGRTSLPQGTERERELHRLSKLSDADLARNDDSLIIEVIDFRSRAPCYEHYIKSVVRNIVNGKVVIYLRFDCKYGDTAHKPHLREQLKLKDGTTNFRTSAASCDHRRGKGPSALPAVPQYTEARHRALIAVHVSAHKHSFLSVEDPEYIEEL